jgi:hypothetical protein
VVGEVRRGIKSKAGKKYRMIFTLMMGRKPGS